MPLWDFLTLLQSELHDFAQEIAQNQGVSTWEVFRDFGTPVGFLILTIGAVKVLWSGYSETLKLERARTERLEKEIERRGQEIERLNKVIYDSTVPLLSKATEAIAEAMRMAERRGGGGR